MEPTEIDLLIYVGVGRGFIEPATANVFQDLIGLRSATCFDILDACASWLRAVHVARAFIASGAYRHIMILNAESGAQIGKTINAASSSVLCRARRSSKMGVTPVLCSARRKGRC